MKKWDWKRWFGIVLMIVGIALIIYHYVPGVQVWLNQQDVSISAYNANQIKDNTAKAKTEQYETNDVKTATPEEVAASRERIKSGKDQLTVLGAVYMPEQKSSASVIAGLSQSALLSGVGTFYPDQKMGENNYPLAFHNMSTVAPNLLLTDMVNNTKKGDKIYLTDLNTVYEYETYFADLVPATRLDLVDESLKKDDKAIITLQTCPPTGADVSRYIVQGKLVKTFPYDKAEKKIIDGFNKA
ncbi:MAG: class A sortase [Aerococcus sp.]|nr:class A sortase [Aerococcus sp.]